MKEHTNLLDLGLYAACKHGHKEIVELLISHGIGSIHSGFYGACSGGHEEIVLLMISRGANHFNGGLQNACYGGHKKIAELMVANGADDFGGGLNEACFNKQKELALLMILYGANINNCFIKLYFEDIYYLLLKGLHGDNFGRYTNIYDQCVVFHSCFYNNMFQILSIEDLAKIVVNY